MQRVEVDDKCSYESLLALASAFDIDVKELTSLQNKFNTSAKFSVSFYNVQISFNWFKARTAIISGLLMAFPALYFILASIFKYSLGIPFLFDPLEILFSSPDILKIFNFISPLVFLLGLMGSFVINLFVMFSIRIWEENSTIKSDISFKPVLANLTLVLLSVCAVTIFFLYAFAENTGG